MKDDQGFIIKEFGPRCRELGLESTIRECIKNFDIKSSVEGTREVHVDLFELRYSVYKGLIEIYPLEGLITEVNFSSTGGSDNKILRSASPKSVYFSYNQYEYCVYFAPKKKV